MSVERQLAEALRAVDTIQPSPDLLARVERSIVETRKSRRRRWAISLLALTLLGAVAGWLLLGVRTAPVGVLVIDGWRLVIAQLAISGALVVTLAPNIRRFARSYVDDVFHLSAGTGDRFLVVLDLAYYVFFAGLLVVDADAWGLDSIVNLSDGLETLFGRVGFVLLAMGLLHAANIALLPALGLVFNSIVRLDLRRDASLDVPDESFRAKVADRNARSFAIGLLVLALALALTFAIGPLGGLISLVG